MDFIKAVFLVILTFAQIACIILVPLSGLAVLFYFIRALFSRFTVASFVDCTYEEVTKKERDRANDTNLLAPNCSGCLRFAPEAKYLSLLPPFARPSCKRG